VEDIEKMRIAQVTSIHADFDKRIWRYCKSLTECGCEVHLISPWIVENSKHEGVNFHSFKRVYKRLLRPIFIPLRLIPKLFKVRNQVDFYHFHDLDILPLMIIWSFFRPVVYDIHENYPDEMLDREYIPFIFRYPLKWVILLIEYVGSRKIKNIIVVCPAQLERFKHENINIFPMMNFSSLKLLDRVRNDDYHSRLPSLIFTGGHYESNGSLLLLDILSELRKIKFDIKLIVIDWFPIVDFRSTFLERAKYLGVLENLDFRKPVVAHEIMTLLNEATIAIAPNLRNTKQVKAVPTKLFEYMAAGLPIVASDLPFVSGMVKVEEYIYLAQPENIQSFVSRIADLITDKQLAARMGQAGQVAFKNYYNWDSQLSNLLTFYSKIVSPNDLTYNVTI
jgi:glycosyltransferase involved in cell wall biosynthesis